MHSHLAIIGKSGPLALKPDSTVTIVEKNPMFNDVEMFSHTFSLPLDGNRHLVQNLENVNSGMRAVDMEGERLQIVMDGVPMRTAVLKVQEDVVVEDAIDVNLDATNRTFKDMIQDMRCRDVEIKDNILIGEKIGDVGLNVNYRQVWDVCIQVYMQEDAQQGSGPWGWHLGHTYIYGKQQTIDGTFQPPALGFSYPAKCVTEADGISAKQEQTIKIDGHDVVTPRVEDSYINTALPYPYAKYCNSRVCYQHYDKETDGADENNQVQYKTSDTLVPAGAATPDDKHNFGPFWVLDADRPASGICFYVGYFLECLFRHLGLAYDMTALTQIEDFNYLCFFTTACKYRTENTDLTFDNVEDINKWLKTRGCGGQLEINEKEAEKINTIQVENATLDTYHDYISLRRDEYQSVDDYVLVQLNNQDYYWGIDLTNQDGSIGPLVSWSHPQCPYQGMDYEIQNYYNTTADILVGTSISACVQEMYATNDNFPDVNVSEVIESLENSFGVRFCYDGETNKVTVRLLRDMLRSQEAPVKLKGEVLSMRKKTEKITGIRMGYAAEADTREQQDNVRYQKKDYDTTYNYIEYPQGRTVLKPYADVAKLVDIGNMNCYVDLATGDAFRIKIDADAKTVSEMRPSLFEVGGMKSIEVGDCSEENKDYVREFRSQFEPIICNILRRDNIGSTLMVPFVDEDMEHELLPMTVQNVMAVGMNQVYFNYNMQLLENYDPSSTDDGQSPLMSHDWGLTVGILRPGNVADGAYNYDDDYDGFGNSRWGIATSDYAVTADSYDVKGNFLGTSPAGSFSLKPAAYKPFRYKYVDDELRISTNPKEWDDTWLIPCNDDVRNADGTIAARIRSRGMADTWMSEFFRFLLERQRYQVEALCTAAELADIPNKWLRWWEIDGKVGLINQVEYSNDIENGLSKAKIDFYAI